MTISEVWKEWKHGINGGPAVSELEKAHGTAWRKSNTDTQFFVRRKPLYSKMESLLSQGMSENYAIGLLEDELKRSKLSLPKFIKTL